MQAFGLASNAGLLLCSLCKTHAGKSDTFTLTLVHPIKLYQKACRKANSVHAGPHALKQTISSGELAVLKGHSKLGEVCVRSVLACSSSSSAVSSSWPVTKAA